MIFTFFLIVFSHFFPLTVPSHFLGGLFTYRHVEQSISDKLYKSVLIEIRFHLSDHYFICTPEQVNQHLIVYLIGESVPYDKINHRYLWYETNSIKKNKYFYNIECISDSHNSACKHFQEKTWAFCESANQNNGYSILRRQFLLIIEKYRSIQLRYSACCWANSVDKKFYLDLFIGNKINRTNSSPYPHIPATYYVDFNKPRVIKMYIYDADDDEIICERFENNLSGFLTVHVDNDCKLTYQMNHLGKQFGQFWLMDRHKNQILSRSLISIQVHVLQEIVCKIQPEIFVETKEDHSNKSIVRIHQSVNITVNLNPNCLSIEPQDQTITELTTLCANSQPIVLANGGIEVVFRCSFNLCEKYHICFVGEFSRKLSSTDIKCFSIEVIGTENECSIALSNHSFVKPHNRQFIIADPVTLTSSRIPSTVSSNSILLQTTTSTLIWSTSSKASLSLESKPRRWLWVSIALIFFLLIGSFGYFASKQTLIASIQHTLNSDRSRLSSTSDSRTTIASDIVPIYPNIKLPNILHEQNHPYDNSPGLSKQAKIRAQHIRLGALDVDEY